MVDNCEGCFMEMSGEVRRAVYHTCGLGMIFPHQHKVIVIKKGTALGPSVSGCPLCAYHSDNNDCNCNFKNLEYASISHIAESLPTPETRQRKANRRGINIQRF